MIDTWRSSCRRPAFASRQARSHTAPPTCPPPDVAPLCALRAAHNAAPHFPLTTAHISLARTAQAHIRRAARSTTSRARQVRRFGAFIQLAPCIATRRAPAAAPHGRTPGLDPRVPPATPHSAPRSLTGACPASAARHTPFRPARDCGGRGTLDVVSVVMMMSPCVAAARDVIVLVIFNHRVR